MIKFKDANDPIFKSKENTDSPQYDLTKDISQISTLDTCNPPIIRSKDLGDCTYDVFKHFGHNEIGWFFLISLDKMQSNS